MSNKAVELDPNFLERQRQQLTTLRDQLQESSRIAETAQSAVRAEGNQQAHEFEDDAQKLDRLETEGELVNRTIARLEQIERALNKIDEGTYGYSDVSGQRIPDARLEAMPDAVTTLAEQRSAERI